jgi:hypothetical protein
VHKIIQVLPQPKGEPLVQTVDYSYNARVRGLGNIFRYDFPHSDHNRFHHVHRFDAFADHEQETVQECEWPTLGQVLEELERWYYLNREQLPATEYP